MKAEGHLLYDIVIVNGEPQAYLIEFSAAISMFSLGFATGGKIVASMRDCDVSKSLPPCFQNVTSHSVCPTASAYTRYLV